MKPKYLALQASVCLSYYVMGNLREWARAKILKAALGTSTYSSFENTYKTAKLKQNTTVLPWWHKKPKTTKITQNHNGHTRGEF